MRPALFSISPPRTCASWAPAHEKSDARDRRVPDDERCGKSKRCFHSAGLPPKVNDANGRRRAGAAWITRSRSEGTPKVFTLAMGSPSDEAERPEWIGARGSGKKASCDQEPARARRGR